MSSLDLRAVGIVVGSATTKLVGLDAVGTMLWHHVEATDPRIDQQAARLLGVARGHAASPDALAIVATGYGRKLVAGARRTLTEVSCHPRGAHAALGHGGTLIDIGGQDSKVIVMAADGSVEGFQMNDKCAAGTGRFLEVAAARLGLGLERLSDMALAAAGEVTISSTCTVFAESELVSLVAHGEPLDRIVRGLVRSLVRRAATLARSVGVRPPLMLSGGVALSAAVRAILAEELGSPIEVPEHPQLVGALGAALFGLEAEGS
jgi:predicted CoA-substrate-specific enzyme activase